MHGQALPVGALVGTLLLRCSVSFTYLRGLVGHERQRPSVCNHRGLFRYGVRAVLL